MLRHMIQTFIWRYDSALTSIVALLPVRLQAYSSRLGRMTLPSIWAAVLAVACLVAAFNDYQKIALLGAAVIACIPIGTLLKLLVRRSRPKTIYAQNMKIKSYSFPSSHTYAATIGGGYFIIISLALLAPPVSIVVSVLLTVFVTMIGISRVHVGAHYPTDVTGGWLLGFAVLFAVVQLVF
ncbi:MAG: Phosphoesterase PA-phosphatase related protein [Candidatus Saccharibacteria bacterium]|nr:Phosphoesterase PA-phosphatase related protein [Candidatus Saccharibacteria bacterium]